MTRIAIVADDLSGAIETAATFLLRTTRISVTLDARAASRHDLAEVLAFDTDSRQASAVDAGARVRAAFRAAIAHDVVFKKIDSILRGHLRAELEAAHDAGFTLVVAPALPAAARTVVDGVVHLDGIPLPQTDAWRAESIQAPLDIAAALAPIATSPVRLDAVRGGNLRAMIGHALDGGAVPICDAETDADLDAIVAATAGVDRLMLVGAAGLAAALARTLPEIDNDAAHDLEIGETAKVLVVVGSAASGIAAQLQTLREAGGEVLMLAPADVVDSAGRSAARDRLTACVSSVVVVAVDAAATVQPDQAREIARGLALVVADQAPQSGGLVLTGGETARAVLDEIGVTHLRPLFQVHHGAVVCAGPDGQLIATRPGSFGDRNSLLSIVRAIQTYSALNMRHANPTEESA